MPGHRMKVGYANLCQKSATIATSIEQLQKEGQIDCAHPYVHLSQKFFWRLVQYIMRLDGNYSERVQLPTKAKFVFFCCQHLPHLLLEVLVVNNGRFADFFDRYFHIPLPIVTKHELGLPFPPRNLPIKFGTNTSTIFLVTVVTDSHKNQRWWKHTPSLSQGEEIGL